MVKCVYVGEAFFATLRFYYYSEIKANRLQCHRRHKMGWFRLCIQQSLIYHQQRVYTAFWSGDSAV
jgi:hypothetical protein